jgi:hypothetical protein
VDLAATPRISQTPTQWASRHGSTWLTSFVARVVGGFVALMAVLAVAPAAAVACGTSHQNVEGYDYTDNHYGNGGLIYVNTSSTLGSLNDTIARSFFDIGSAGNDVEVGWTDHNGGYNSPTVYAEWVNRGVDGNPQFYTGYSLSYNTNYTFKVQNTGHVYIWRYYIDGQGSPFNYSPTMNFQQGTVVTNSERYNTCDSMWTHMYSLEYFSSGGSWNPYSSLAEYACDATDGWELNIRSNTELYVDQNGGSC